MGNIHVNFIKLKFSFLKYLQIFWEKVKIYTTLIGYKCKGKWMNLWWVQVLNNAAEHAPRILNARDFTVSGVFFPVFILGEIRTRKLHHFLPLPLYLRFSFQRFMLFACKQPLKVSEIARALKRCARPTVAFLNSYHSALYKLSITQFMSNILFCLFIQPMKLICQLYFDPSLP